ncbi:siderophore-interacting protein [Sanguibacter keddieii DSM 10542]|uniref:Siderophore-interacting protein n=1 Tax=Sanguibacter keddieii (strain ATCC 51767 / DSM 10542 / NCFB 3025 / ST-74) TaxID=446469 RepID=D1BHZ4_SANKS|nr:siderophore-interacting protein [Sanguibacter keddieii]ACZ22064.1 siderophore-interacting protein [Sanguibacter keddieii DSM 10542]
MARTNLSATRLKPEVSELLTLEVLRREQVSPSFVRVTLGGGDAEKFVPMGFDQWFRLFIPVADGTLGRLPQKLDTLSYLRFLTISKATRPVLRNYTVRAYRADGPRGPEIDVDLVVHGSVADGTSGPAATWAQTCTPGDVVAILDEGIGFNPPAGVDRVLLVADETGLPAVAGILASLPATATGTAVVEIPADGDQQDMTAPPGVEVRWVVRTDPHAVPGRAALAAVQAFPVTDEPFYGWAVGEAALPVALRRHWVAAGLPKENIMFCGYWKVGKAH